MNRSTLVRSGASFVVIGLMACSDKAERACQVDADCAQGSVCRDGSCASANSDGGTTPPEAGSGTCSTDGLLCASVNECCSGTCTGGRCGPAAPPISSPTCKSVYELCQSDDCCDGLKCVAGSCR